MIEAVVEDLIYLDVMGPTTHHALPRVRQAAEEDLLQTNTEPLEEADLPVEADIPGLKADRDDTAARL